jgi:DNA repair protein RecN (Recombination protein N)
MIKTLSIRNYAIIDSLEIDFTKGFTTITGETGAGKSIMLGALNLLLGHRFESVNFKNQSLKCIVEGVFQVSDLNIEDFFMKYNLDYEDNLIIRREFVFEGKSRSFINDTPVKLDILKDLSFFLVDIHSQHENLLIHNATFQINLLDNFSRYEFPEFTRIVSDYSSDFNSLQKLKLDYEHFDGLLKNPDLDFEYNQEIVGEIDALNLQLNEKEQLELEYKKINNIHNIKSILSEIIFLFENSESPIINTLHTINSKLSGIQEYDLKILEIFNRLEANVVDMNDVLMEIHTVRHELQFDPARFEFIENRLNTINHLERKINVFSFNELLNKVEILRKKLKDSKNLHQKMDKIKVDMEILEGKMSKISSELTFFRKKSAIFLSDLIKEDLLSLGINNPSVSFDFSVLSDFSPSGLDKVNLLFSANKGYDLKPILDVASGGEIARLMLCIKKHLFKVARFSTIIFDEIDSGVSGDIGRKMGRILQEMSINGQVICITHLPQIASLGTMHYKILKQEFDKKTVTKISELTDDKRIQEIARMLSGDEVNEEAIANAKKMLDI